MSQPSLTDQLQSDLTEAMKSRDEVATSTIRMLLSAIRTAEVAGDQAITLDHDQTTAVLQSEAKKRSEAAEVYDEAGRDEAAAAERAQLGVIERYLPEPMSSEELGAIVDDEIDKYRATTDQELGPKMMGPIIGAVNKRVGAAADGGTVAAAVKARLLG